MGIHQGQICSWRNSGRCLRRWNKVSALAPTLPPMIECRKMLFCVTIVFFIFNTQLSRPLGDIMAALVMSGTVRAVNVSDIN